MDRITSSDIRSFAQTNLQGRRVDSGPVRKLLVRVANRLEELEGSLGPPAQSRAAGSGADASGAAAAALLLQNAQDAATRTLEAASRSRGEADAALARAESDAKAAAAGIITDAENRASRIIVEAKRQAAIEATAAITQIEEDYRRRAALIRDEAGVIAAAADRLDTLGRTARQTHPTPASSQLPASQLPSSQLPSSELPASRPAVSPGERDVDKSTALPTAGGRAKSRRRGRKRPDRSGAAADRRPPPPAHDATKSPERVPSNDLNTRLFADAGEIDLRLDPPTATRGPQDRSDNQDFFGP